MANRTVKGKLITYSVDEIVKAGGVDAFLKMNRINTARRRISGMLRASPEETKQLLAQLSEQK